MTQTLGEWVIGQGRLKDSAGDATTLQDVLKPGKLTFLPDAQARIIAMLPAIRLN